MDKICSRNDIAEILLMSELNTNQSNPMGIKTLSGVNINDTETLKS